VLAKLKSQARPRQKLEQLTKSKTKKGRSRQKKKVTCWVENLKEWPKKKLGLNKFLIVLNTCKGSLDKTQVKGNKEAECLKPKLGQLNRDKSCA